MLQTSHTKGIHVGYANNPLLRIFFHPCSVRSRSVSGASTGLSSSPLSSPRVSDYRSILHAETALTVTQHTVTQVILSLCLIHKVISIKAGRLK